MSFPQGSATEPQNATYTLVLSAGVVDNPAAVGTYSIPNQFSTSQGNVDCPSARRDGLWLFGVFDSRCGKYSPDDTGRGDPHVELGCRDPRSLHVGLCGVPTTDCLTWDALVRDHGAGSRPKLGQHPVPGAPPFPLSLSRVLPGGGGRQRGTRWPSGPLWNMRALGRERGRQRRCPLRAGFVRTLARRWRPTRSRPGYWPQC